MHPADEIALKCTRLKQLMKPFFCFSHVASEGKIASLCGGTTASPVPLSFLCMIRLSVPLKGLNTALEGSCFPPTAPAVLFPFHSLYSVVLSLIKEVRHPSALNHATA